MATKTSYPPRMDDPDRGPLLGNLLRIAHHNFMGEVMRGLAEAGYGDIEPSHTGAMRPLWDAPEGAHATELAAAARITKQSMGELIDHLDVCGYVERIDDPGDKRAKLVRLTRRGREAGRTMRSLVRAVESDWARRIGLGHLATLKEALRALVGSLESKGESIRPGASHAHRRAS